MDGIGYMDIIAHRGFWKVPKEKNHIKALKCALDQGFGIETDIRDYKGELVISHNIADGHAICVKELLRYYADIGADEPLALNVKADGIQGLLRELLDEYKILNYFLFDMSVPEQVVNHNMNLNYYTRHSDVENVCVLYADAIGVWLDSFYDDKWLTADIIKTHMSAGKKVCVVSPELHGKEYLPTWKMIKENQFEQSELMQLCTDKPDEARRFFYE